MFPTLHERERETESSWTAVRAQPDECACCRTEFYPWPNGPCYRALCFFGLGRLPSGRGEGGPGGRCVAGLGQSEHAVAPAPLPGGRRDMRRHAALSDFRGLVPARYGYSGVRPISNHAESSARNHTTSKRLRGRGRAPRTILAGGGSQVAHVVPASRMRGEFRCVLGCCSDGRHAPATFGRHAPSRVRAAAAVAAANSGPIVTHGVQSGVKSGDEMHRSTSSQAQKIGRWTAPPVFSHILPFNGLCLYGSCRPHLRP